MKGRGRRHNAQIGIVITLHPQESRHLNFCSTSEQLHSRYLSDSRIDISAKTRVLIFCVVFFYLRNNLPILINLELMLPLINCRSDVFRKREIYRINSLTPHWNWTQQNYYQKKREIPRAPRSMRAANWPLLLLLPNLV